MFGLQEHPQRRYNPLSGEWVVVSPQRMRRPWHGQVEAPPPVALPAYDPDCYLCPGNVRAGGVRNPVYNGVYVFENDFAALQTDIPAVESNSPADELFQVQAARGLCRVLCFSPRHDLSLSALDPDQLQAVVAAWASQTAELEAHPSIQYVQIFENRGAMMGASNPHPHCQIWATAFLPTQVAREQRQQQEYFERHGRTLLADYLVREVAEGTRLVYFDAHTVVLVPFWAVWPFETLLICRRPVASLNDLAPVEQRSVATALQRLSAAYDALFQTPFPYSMGWHQRPAGGMHPEWHLHAHFYPPLLRSATVRKFMVGFELLAEAQRDLTPEAAAARLRAC